MIITTAELIPNVKITNIKDVIFSEQVIAVSAAKDIGNVIKGFLGGRLDGYANEYKIARKNSVDDLKKQAEEIEGDAVIGLRVSYGEFINSDMLFITAMAYGTVVEIEKLQVS